MFNVILQAETKDVTSEMMNNVSGQTSNTSSSNARPSTAEIDGEVAAISNEVCDSPALFDCTLGHQQAFHAASLRLDCGVARVHTRRKAPFPQMGVDPMFSSRMWREAAGALWRLTHS